MSGIVFGCVVPHAPIIVPEIGRGGEAEISVTRKAMETVTDRLAQHKPDTALIISPHGKYAAHAMGILTAPSSAGDLKMWGSQEPHQTYQNDLALGELLHQEAI